MCSRRVRDVLETTERCAGGWETLPKEYMRDSERLCWKNMRAIDWRQCVKWKKSCAVRTVKSSLMSTLCVGSTVSGNKSVWQTHCGRNRAWRAHSLQPGYTHSVRLELNVGCGRAWKEVLRDKLVGNDDLMRLDSKQKYSLKMKKRGTEQQLWISLPSAARAEAPRAASVD